ncbi:MAG: isochorismatase family protein [Alphaproteobacteria bacterium]|nr:isochorismatase family protein [Alphaproteobacteria bacterium]
MNRSSTRLAPPRKIAHIAMDVQDKYTHYFYGDGQEKTFPIAIRTFADDLQKIGIPTIWVAWGTHAEFKYYSKKVTAAWPDKKRNVLLNGLTLTCCPIGRDEEIFSKGDNDAFFDGTLAKILKSQGYDAILLTGMDTGACVVESLNGAMKEGIRCIVISDLVADSCGEKHGKSDWHINEIGSVLKAMNEAPTAFEHMTGAEALKAFAPKQSLAAQRGQISAPSPA